MTRATEPGHRDVLVLGGGAAGLAFALSLNRLMLPLRPGFRITVVESGAAPTRPVAGDIGMRVLALSPASRQFLSGCGVPLTPDFACSYRRMVVWQRELAKADSRISFEAAELGVPELGSIADLAVVRWLLWQRSLAAGIEVLTGESPAALAQATDELCVTLNSGSPLAGRLVVGADGAASWLRQALHIDVAAREYGQRAIVAHVRSSQPHAETAWQRFLATGPVALLPLPDGRSSLVWSAAEDLAAELLGLDDAAFSARLTDATQRVIGTLAVDTPRIAFPLRAMHAASYTGSRAALIGDAAHQIHPLAGLGANLGFADAAALSAALAVALADPDADPGDLRTLRCYERSRRGRNAAALNLMTALHRLFAESSAPGLREFAGTGLGLLDRLPPLKNGLARLAMGA